MRPGAAHDGFRAHFSVRLGDRVPFLSATERRLQACLKHAYLGLASLERTMARQRAKIAWVREGGANTAFFHQHASYRKRKNVIHNLQVDGAVVLDHAAMAQAAFDHFLSLWVPPRSVSCPGTLTSSVLGWRTWLTLRRHLPRKRFGRLCGSSLGGRRQGPMVSQRRSSNHVGGR